MTVNVEHIHLRQDEEYPVEFVLTKIREYSKNGKVPSLPPRIDKYLEKILKLGGEIFANMEDSKRKSRMRIELHKIDNALHKKKDYFAKHGNFEEYPTNPKASKIHKHLKE